MLANDKNLLWLLLFGLYLMVAGQLQAKVNNLQLEHLGVEDGLSQGTANSIMQDDSGFIWIASQNGVDIYDGYHVRKLHGPDGDFSHFSVQGLMQDSQGLMWINLNSKGLYSYNPKNNHYQFILAHDQANKDYYVVKVIEFKSNKFWIATSKTLLLYDATLGTFSQVLDLSAELTSKDNIFEITQHNNVLYIGTRIGIFAYHIDNKQWLKLPPINSIDGNGAEFNAIEAAKSYNLYVSNQQVLFIGTNNGVFSLNVADIEEVFAQRAELTSYQQLIAGISTWQFFQDKQQLYIASHKGLYVVDIDSKISEYLFGFSDTFSNVTDNVIKSIWKDRQGMFWLGTNALGIFQWQPRRELITNYRYQRDHQASLSFNEIWSILPDQDQSHLLWVGSSNGLNLINDQQQTVTQFLVNKESKAQYTQSYIGQMMTDTQGRLWLSTPKGMRLFDRDKKQLIEIPYSEAVRDILKLEQFSCVLDKKDNLWLLNEKGIYKVSLLTGEIDVLDALTEKVTAGSIYNLLGFLPNSNLFLVSTSSALWGYDPQSQAVSLLYQHPNVSATEWSLIENWAIDKHNILWLSYPSKGLVGLSLPDFKAKYFYHQGNTNINVDLYGVQADQEGDIWFSSHNGIYMLNSDDHHFRHFTVKHGLVSTEFNGRAYIQLNDHRMVYGSMEGISIFDPLELKNLFQQQEPTVRVSQVAVLSRHLALPLVLQPEANIALNYDDVGIRIDVSAFSFVNQSDIRFEYTLSGEQNITYPITPENFITFPSLPSGRHTLEVRSISPISGKLSPASKIHFNVSYAPWASPAAYFTYAVLLSLSLGYWLYRRKVQREKLLQINAELAFRENRLQLALIGSNSEVWDWQAHDNLMFGKRASQELGFFELATSYRFSEHVDLIHPDDRDSFLSSWQLFLQKGDVNENFACTYRLKSFDGRWLWYKDLGKIVELSENGEPCRITGSYTNITDSRAAEERALYYGDAFKQTKDWVLIISENFTRVTANQSLCDVFGWQEEDASFAMLMARLSGKRQDRYQKVLSSLKAGEHWRGEELIKIKNNEEYHVIVNINASQNTSTNRLHYICVFTDISAQKTAEQELRYLANYDHLTSLPNRSLLLERIKHAIDYSKRRKRVIALFFIDLDRFKQVNDSLGHEYGDMLLQEVTARLTHLLRVDDTVARIGGDEFVVLLESFKCNADLTIIANKIIGSIELPVTLNENVVSVGASIGIALYPNDALDSDGLLRHADVAMYHAKQLGRGNFQFFTEKMNVEARSRLEDESNIRLAHKNNEFINHYQPIVDARIGKAIGVELLMRWQTADGLKAPGAFIPLAEELGLIVSMTERAFDRGLADLKIWRQQRENFYLSVNIAPQHFTQDGLITYIKKILLEYELPAQALKLEVTESALILEPEKAIQTMKALSELGVVLALDDFGTGFSSLSYLKNLPLDILKIDRAFISGIGTINADEAIVDTTLVLAKRLSMACIAEGVETQEQLDYLAVRECHFIQGYLYSKPVDAQQITIYLQENKAQLSTAN